MVSLFLVEDERIPRESIRNNVHWQENNLLYLGDAADGEMALSQILQKKPDILITDIKMPFMDGLELSRIVREKLPDTKIIILSGYNDFDYARQAISLGISEYLLKPVSAADILGAVNKVRLEIEHSRKEQMTWQDNQTAQREIFLSSVFSGYLDDTFEILKRAEQIGLDMSAGVYQVGRLQIGLADSVGDQRSGILLNPPSGILACGYTGQQVVYLIRAQNEAKAAEKEKNLQQWCIKMADQLGVQAWLSMGKRVSRLTDLVHAYRTAVQRQTANDAHGHLNGLSDSSAPFENDTLLEFLRVGRLSMARCFWDDYRKVIQGGFDSLIYRCYLYAQLFFVIRKFCQETETDIPKALTETGLLEKRIESDHRVESFLDFGCALCSEVIAKRDEAHGGRYAPAADLAREYIDRHYADQGLSLGIVAEAVRISPNHLSTVFKGKLGVGFSEYLTEVRLRQAKHLLKTTDMRASDVAQKVGYQNVNYFSMLFKRVVGTSPSQFRRGIS